MSACYTEASWTGTIEDGYNASPLSFDGASGDSCGGGEIVKVRARWTASTEAAGISFIVYGDSGGADDLLSDTLVAGEVEANAAYISDTAVGAVSADGFWFVAKCDTGAASATGTITFIIRRSDKSWTGPSVRAHTIDATGNPSDA